jgi:hypothetical protein
VEKVHSRIIKSLRSRRLTVPGTIVGLDELANELVQQVVTWKVGIPHMLQQMMLHMRRPCGKDVHSTMQSG